MTDHGTACAEFMFNAANHPSSGMADLPGAMAVSEELPTVVADEFPPQRYRCPHGVQHYAYPTPERIEALHALNRATQEKP